MLQRRDWEENTTNHTTLHAVIVSTIMLLGPRLAWTYACGRKIREDNYIVNNTRKLEAHQRGGKENARKRAHGATFFGHLRPTRYY
jgi:hypothetical protein